jgi:hypothetical protein
MRCERICVCGTHLPKSCQSGDRHDNTQLTQRAQPTKKLKQEWMAVKTTEQRGLEKDTVESVRNAGRERHPAVATGEAKRRVAQQENTKTIKTRVE